MANFNQNFTLYICVQYNRVIVKVLSISSTNIIKNCVAKSKNFATKRQNIIGATPTLPVPTPQKGKGFISTYITPLLKKVKSGSTSISAISEGCSEIGRNVKKAKAQAKENNTSSVTATLKGLKNSGGAIKTTLGEIAGVNDVILAKEQGGTSKAVIEGGKSAVRVLLSSALTVACLPIPVPGAMIGGWVAGEKIAEKIVGKPISKQIGKLK